MAKKAATKVEPAPMPAGKRHHYNEPGGGLSWHEGRRADCPICEVDPVGRGNRVGSVTPLANRHVS